MPAGLEDRILAAVKEAQKVVPIQSRASRALSWAGSWAMRPQTAMAAVFLLMIGTSAFVIRSRHGGADAAGERAAAVSVTEKGEPAGQAPASDDHDSLDNKAAAAAHGANVPVRSAVPPTTVPPATASAALALNEDPSSAGVMDGITAGKGRGKMDESNALSSALEDELKGQDKTAELKKDESKRDAEQRTVTQRSVPRPADNAAMGKASAPAGAPYQDYAPDHQAVAPPPATKSPQEPQDGFSAGMAAYRSRQFGEATRQFDTAARTGDQNAALWAAKSVKEGNGGCGVAIPRFDAIASKSPGTWLGNEATLEAARCQIATGQLEPAREKLTKLTSVPSHAPAAQQALNELSQGASRREAERAKAGSAGGAGNGRPATAAPRAPAPAKPASADKASGF
jgi:hypothetical protein